MVEICVVGNVLFYVEVDVDVFFFGGEVVFWLGVYG